MQIHFSIFFSLGFVTEMKHFTIYKMCQSWLLLTLTSREGESHNLMSNHYVIIYAAGLSCFMFYSVLILTWVSNQSWVVKFWHFTLYIVKHWVTVLIYLFAKSITSVCDVSGLWKSSLLVSNCQKHASTKKDKNKKKNPNGFLELVLNSAVNRLK